MTFDDILAQVLDLLQRQGRVSYSALRRRFEIDDAYLDDLKDELLFAHPVVDEEGRGLVWSPWFAAALGTAYVLSDRVADALPLLEYAVERSAAMRVMTAYVLAVAAPPSGGVVDYHGSVHGVAVG